MGSATAMLMGLVIYGCAALVATQAEHFITLLAARAVSAFGIAVGSVVTQTILRDVFSGNELGKVFSLMGMGIAISPVLGMLLGGQLTLVGGYRYVFFALFALALVLLVYNVFKLPETQTEKKPVKIMGLGIRMLLDARIWQSALLIAVYNIALFSYYQLGAFQFSKLGYGAEQFGYSGIVLGIGTLFGSFLNKALLSNRTPMSTLLWIAATSMALGAFGVYCLIGSILFVAPMMLVVIAFGIAIPNILSVALTDYKQEVGSAGALFGLVYYLLIGGGLALAGTTQHLGVVLVACSVTVALVTLFRKA